MYFLLSGEGTTDIGECADGARACDGNGFRHGPMTVIVDQIVERATGASILQDACGFVSKRLLTERAEELKAARKSVRLPGKKRAKETRYFFNNARVLARIARERERALNDTVVAVLFRDSDGTASAGRGLWEEKRQSMLDGFVEEGFDRGVPMIPTPKSEAWLLCALKKHPYQNCAQLEARSGNDRSPHSLKGELSAILGDVELAETLCGKLANGIIDIERIAMPSFDTFRRRLLEVI